MKTTTGPMTDSTHKRAAPRRSRTARAITPDQPEPVVHDNPRDELRRLIHMHAWWTRDVQRMTMAVTDRKTKDGDVIPHNKPEHVVSDMLAAAKSLAGAKAGLERAIEKQLRGIPIWDELLEPITGAGAKTGGYLVAMVDIAKVAKVSQLIRYCGNAPDVKTGRAERRHAAPKALDPTSDGSFNEPLKIALVQAMLMMRQLHVRRGKPGGRINKYLRRWIDAKHTALTIPNARLGRVMRNGEADDKGRKKATDLFLWDVYVMWRTLDGLPVMADKYSNERGVFHGGIPVWDGPRMLTLDEARAIVGDVTSRPYDWPADEEEADDDMAQAAE